MRFTRPLTPFLQRLPGICQVCARWPAHTICNPCAIRFGATRNRCITCAHPLHGDRQQCGACLTERHPSPLALCLAAVDYAYPWDTLIARFKFRDEPALAHPFAALMLQQTQVKDLLQNCDGIVPIPISSARLAERGYNQAWELAKALQGQTGIDARKGLPLALVRTGQAPDQHNLPAEQRVKNLKGSFAADPDHTLRIQGKNLLLIDDVSTTGATLRAASTALKQAGAGRVSALVLARTVAG